MGFPYMPWFPEPGSYIRFLDFRTGAKEVAYRRLVWSRSPFVYPRRLAAVAVGSKSSTPLTLDEINPSDTKKHMYLAYFGLKPGFLYQISHPADIRLLKWDETIRDIDEDRTGFLSADMSPYEYPTKALGIDRDRYPQVVAINVGRASAHPEVVVVASLYLFDDRLTPDELGRLKSGALRSYPWDFGGEL